MSSCWNLPDSKPGRDHPRIIQNQEIFSMNVLDDVLEKSVFPQAARTVKHHESCLVSLT